MNKNQSETPHAAALFQAMKEGESQEPVSTEEIAKLLRIKPKSYETLQEAEADYDRMLNKNQEPVSTEELIRLCRGVGHNLAADRLQSLQTKMDSALESLEKSRLVSTFDSVKEYIEEAIEILEK